jgi:hypothetical protein
MRGWWTRQRNGMLLLTIGFVLLLPFSLPRIALSDEVQYFAYLRSLYFDGDLDFRNEYEYFAQQGLANGDPAVFNALLREDAVNPNPVTGLLRNVAPVGSALLWAPGFVLADLWVQAANAAGAEWPRDGFSRPYLVGVSGAAALYSLLGLLLTYRLAAERSSPAAALLATAGLFLATPLVFYTYLAMAWSHSAGFFLAALFLTVWLRGRGKSLAAGEGRRSTGSWLLLGLIGGLLVMTREQLGLLLLLPLGEALYRYGRLLGRRDWRALRGQLAQHLLFVATLVLAVTPQLAAYQVLNGRPLPSATVGSKLATAELGPLTVLISPRFFDTLIDPAHGALLWSPLLALALLGFVPLLRKDLLLGLLALLGIAGQVYINGAFGTTWHLSGSFGFRRLIEVTPLFALALAVLIEVLQRRIGWWPLLIGMLLLVAWNVGLIAQWTLIRPELRKGLIWDGMLRYQLIEVPSQIGGRLWDVLFDRCRLTTNPGC